MAKSKTSYVCSACGSVYPKWSGKCEACGEWNTLTEEMMEAAPQSLGKGKGKALSFSAMDGTAETPPRYPTAIGELDRVLGGGLVPGSAILIGGDPGIGKSTLLLQAVAKLAASGLNVRYVSGEESVAQIQMRAARLGVAHAAVGLAAGNAVRDILSSLDGSNFPSLRPPHDRSGTGAPDVLVIDSIQTMYLDTLESAPGTVAQVRAASNELIRYAKKKGCVLLLVGHVTKDGQIAGPRVLEHMVDCVLYFEGDRGQMFRILRTVKNRFGATDEIGVFEMGEKGLSEVANPSSLFLPERDNPVSGSAILAGMEGTRPMLVEIQALVTPSPMATPRRAVVGWDSARLAMILAVLEARAGVRLADREVYLNIAGGLRISEPAADLAVAAALLSAAWNVPLPRSSVFYGEVALSGEVRSVASSDQRLKEAIKLGFTRAFCPNPSPHVTGGKKAVIPSGLVPISHVQELLEMLKACGENVTIKKQAFVHD